MATLLSSKEPDISVSKVLKTHTRAYYEVKVENRRRGKRG